MAAHCVPVHKPMDRGFIAFVLGAASTSLARMRVRHTTVMPLMLCVHRGIIRALSLTMPYSKFAHGAYRCATLLTYAVEKRRVDSVAGVGE
jgi:citrate/tricarballylate utilization protein